MELFAITCTTCQQRLKVRDASTIGEIQICPKCGSMVLVEPPAGWRETPGDEPPAPALPPTSPLQTVPAEADFATAPEVASPPPVAADISAEPEVAAMDAANAGVLDGETGIESRPIEPVPAPPLDGEGPALAAGTAKTGSGLLVAPPLEGEEPAAAPSLPLDAGTGQAAWQRQSWLMLSGAAVLGVALALGVLGFLASRGPKPNSADSAAAASDVTAGVNQAHTPPADASRPAGVPAAGSASATGKTPEATKADAAPAAPATSQPATAPPAKPSDPSSTKAPSATDAEPAKTSPAAVQGGIPDAARKPAAPEKTDPDTAALSEALKEFAPFIDSNVNPAPPETMEAGNQETTPPEPEPITTEQPAVPRPEPRQIDLPARLQDKIAEVEFADVPLEAFLRFVMSFSTIPITLDLDALALVRATPRTKVSVRTTNATVDQLLTAVLGPLQLAHVTVGQQLIVTRAPRPDGELRTHSHAVSDLVGSDPQQLQQLADLIEEMVEPATWQAAGGPGVMQEQMPALVIQQQDTVLFQAIVFCERLRAARGLPPQSKFNPELFSLTPPWARASSLLVKPVTLNFLQPASLVRILSRMSEDTGLAIVVDWQALATLGWTPDTETTLAVNQRPADEVLTQLLQPMELTYRIVDATTVQVTSPAAVEARWDVEFYPVKDLPAPGETPEAFVARIRRELGGGQSGQSAGVLHYDAPSQHLIAALPQPLQRKLADLLKNSRTR